MAVACFLNRGLSTENVTALFARTSASLSQYGLIESARGRFDEVEYQRQIDHGVMTARQT